MPIDLKWREIHKNVFFITNNQEGIIYSPLQGKFFSADGDAQEIIREYLESDNQNEHSFRNVLDNANISLVYESPEIPKQFPYKPTGIMLSLSNLCNLRCIYCYAEMGRNKPKILADNAAKQAIRKVLEFAIETNERIIEIAFHGTGETLVRWNNFTKIVDYALSVKPELIDIEFSLVTNGTLLNSDKARFLATHGFFVSLSLDGTQEIQDKQRPTINGSGSFAATIKGIEALVKEDISFVVRSTVTGESIKNMPNFVRLCASLGCKQISLMPFSTIGNGANGITPLDCQMYIENYLKAKKIAKQYDIHLSMAGTQIDKTNIYFCGAIGSNCIITPENQISTCSRVTKADDPLASVFMIGVVDQSGFSIDTAKANELIRLNLYSYNDCLSCFAKYICAGGCPHDRLTYGNIMPPYWCEIVRTIIWHEIRDLAIDE